MPNTNRPKSPSKGKKLTLTSINDKPVKKVPGAKYYQSSGSKVTPLDKNGKPIKKKAR